MSDFEPGTVAEVTFLGKRYRAMRTGVSSNMGWEIAIPGQRDWTSDLTGRVTDIRPLVVLDLDYIRFENFGQEDVLRTLRNHSRTRPIADQIEAQARIPEPGLWGVVEARLSGLSRERFTFVHTTTALDEWTCTEDGSFHKWSTLIDPVLVREGVES